MSNNPFTAARPYLWDGSLSDDVAAKQRFLCHALESAYKDYKISAVEFFGARGIIRTRLGEYRFLEQWLANEAGISINDLVQENMQAYRLRWLETLEQQWNQGETQ